MPLWLDAAPLVLASRSSARRTLLETAGIPIEAHPADLDERSLETAATSQEPAAVAAFLARAKAAAVAASQPGRLVLGADQTLALGTRRFSKPVDRAGARAQLTALRGDTHELHSAIVFMQNANVLFEHVETARLTMRPFSPHFLETYLDSAGDAVTGSVGAYQIEGLGIQLFECLDGSYFTILGLPLLQTLAFLRQRGSLAS
jgi:septum formation protein